MPEESAARFVDTLRMWVRVDARDARVTRVRLVDAAPVDASADDGFAAGVAVRVAAVAEGARDALTDVALDEGPLTPFQRRVLAALRRVGPGETTTYAALAEAIGQPGAARAVGGAVAANPFLVLVPCHRVLPQGGRVGNYSGPGGVATKRALLAAEGARVPGIWRPEAPLMEPTGTRPNVFK